MSPTPSENPFGRGSSVRVIGHRGAAGVRPENTLPSFEHAVDVGVDAVEFDLQCTRDDELVVMHDPFVDRVTEGEGSVKEMSYDELAELDAGFRFSPAGEDGHPYRGRGIRVPRLEEVLEVTGDLPLIAEVKSRRAGRRLAEWLRESSRGQQARSRLLVGGFSREALQGPRREARWSCATQEDLRWYVLLSKLGLGGLAVPERPDALMLPERYRGILPVVTDAFVDRAHRDGLGVYVWTVNDPERMRRLHGMGVDGMLSDYPERLKRLYERELTPTPNDSSSHEEET